MKVTVDDKSGFCFGVVNAISKAEELISEGRKVYSLGDIVHNDLEVARLKRAGVDTITHEQIAEVGGDGRARILLRAHGEPLSTYRLLERLGLDYTDATCPVVAKLQKLTVEAERQMEAEGGQVVILGKRGHAEVVGLNGQIDDRAMVVESVEDLDAVDFSRPVYLISQTTQSLALFEKIKEEVFRRAEDPSKVIVRDTICRQVAGREAHLGEFAASFDAVVFVCGQKSSNGKVLFEACRAANPKSLKIESPDQLSADWFEGVETVGVCGATSTPNWLMKEAADKILSFGKTF